MKFEMLKSMHLLIVEDDEVAATFLANTLKEIFMTVSVVFDGQRALLHISQNLVDVLITDLAMPCCSGVRLIESIRKKEQKEKRKALPIIVISARQDSSELMEIVRFSLIDYLLKPVTFVRLNQALERLDTFMSTELQVLYRIDEEMFYDPLIKSLRKGSVVVPLTALEASLLEVLLSNKGRIFSKTTLMEEVYRQEVQDATFRNLLVRLRKKVGKEHLISYRDLGIKFQ